jgi:SAM-dependent methyltransferase
VRRVLAPIAAATRATRVRRAERRHRSGIAALLDAGTAQSAFATGGELPAGLGRGLSERAVEYPWFLAQAPAGALLDAGGTLNHAWVVERLPAAVERMHVVTLAAEPEVGDPRVTYERGDLRSLPLPDASFDVVACLSTLEHVGMDLRGYGIGGGTAADPQQEAAAAVRELRRVLRPGGRLLISVPYGSVMTIGSMRQLQEADLHGLAAAFGAKPAVEIFAYGAAGWARSTPSAAAGARYRDRFAEPVARDGAQAARAVACLSIAAAQPAQPATTHSNG